MEVRDRRLPSFRAPSRPSVLLRADAGPHRGYGHVMRCLTLGAELRRRGWRVTLLGQDLSPFLCSLAASEGIRVRQMKHPVASSHDAGEVVGERADLVVVDGYDFPQRYFEFLDQESARYVVIDDNGLVAPEGALFVINQNPHAHLLMYPGHDPRRLLLGTEFAMVREQVTRLAKASPTERQESKPAVLVSIGGTDIGGLTYGATEALLKKSNWHVTASLADPPAGAVSAPADIATVLSEATVAVIGAGSTLWEACFLGVPAVALIVADNQAAGATVVSAMGACDLVDLRGDADLQQVAFKVERLVASPSVRLEMSRVGRRLIDGRGAARVVDFLERTLETS